MSCRLLAYFVLAILLLVDEVPFTGALQAMGHAQEEVVYIEAGHYQIRSRSRSDGGKEKWISVICTFWFCIFREEEEEVEVTNYQPPLDHLFIFISPTQCSRKIDLVVALI